MAGEFEVFFTDKARKPAEADLAELLGRAVARWDELRARIAEEHAPLVEDWTYGGKSWGWALRLKRKKRAVLYMTPAQRHFRVVDRPTDGRQPCFGFAEHTRRRDDLSRTKSTQQTRQRVVVIGIGMGKKDSVKLRDAH